MLPLKHGKSWFIEVEVLTVVVILCDITVCSTVKDSWFFGRDYVFFRNVGLFSPDYTARISHDTTLQSNLSLCSLFTNACLKEVSQFL
jgi:hypothetical protein